MMMNVNFRNIDGDASTVNYINQRLSFALARTQHEVRSTAVTLSDVNGPKGGLDKQCKIVLKANGLKEIVISERQPDVHQAINRGIARASQNLARQLKRKQQSKRGKFISKLPEQATEDEQLMA